MPAASNGAVVAASRLPSLLFFLLTLLLCPEQRDTLRVEVLDKGNAKAGQEPKWVPKEVEKANNGSWARRALTATRLLPNHTAGGVLQQAIRNGWAQNDAVVVKRGKVRNEQDRKVRWSIVEKSSERIKDSKDYRVANKGWPPASN